MTIEIYVHDRSPDALAEMVAVHEGQPMPSQKLSPFLAAHVQAVLDKEERDAERRRAAWHWLNSVSTGVVDRDNDWSDL